MEFKDAQIGMIVVLNQPRGRFVKGDKFEIVGLNDFDGLLVLKPHADNLRGWNDGTLNWFPERVDPVVQEPKWIENEGGYLPQVGDRIVFRDMVYAPDAIRNMHPWWLGGMDKFSGKEAEVESISEFDRKVFTVKDGNGYNFNQNWVAKYQRAGAVGKAAEPAVVIQFKKGDYVKIVKQHVEGKLKWLDAVDDTIGDICKVKSFDERTSTYLLDNGYSYLVQSLTKATDEEVKAKKAKKQSLRTIIAKARKEFIPQVNDHGVCNFITFTRNNNGEIKVNDEIGAPCHAALDVSYEEGNKRVGKDFKVVGVLDLLQDYEEGIDKKYHRAYFKFVDWAVNHSPWSIAYEKKSVKNIIENGVLLDVSKPAIVIGGACINLRFMKEFNQYLPTFEKLLKAGVSPAAAYLAAYSFDVNGRKKDSYTLGTMYGGHQVLYAGMKAGGVLSFMANGFDEATLKQKPYAEAPNYRGIQENISKTKDRLGIATPWNQFVKNNVKFAEEKQGWTTVLTCKLEDVLAFGKLVDEHINKARDAQGEAAIINPEQAAA